MSADPSHPPSSSDSNQDRTVTHGAAELPSGGLDDTGLHWQPGLTVGRFVLERLLGRGGFGEVWLARDERLNRQVAIKCLLPRWAGHPGVRERFEREARLLAVLEHPALVRVLELGGVGTAVAAVGSADSAGKAASPWFAMEYLPDARPLDRMLDEGWSPKPWEAAWYVAAYARALEHIHAQGFVHRDVKPANVLVTSDPDRPVVMIDLGIAKEEAATLGFTGTPAYQAPEVAARGQYSAQSDVYALGVVFYECLLNGRKPWAEDGRHQHLAGLRTDREALHQRLYASLPVDLAAVLEIALAEDLWERYPSAGAMADDLEAYLDGRVPKVLAVSTVSRAFRATRRTARERPAAFAGSVVLGLALAIGGGWGGWAWFGRAAQEGRVARQAAEAEAAGRRALEAGLLSEADSALASGRDLARGLEEDYGREDLSAAAGAALDALARDVALARAQRALEQAEAAERAAAQQIASQPAAVDWGATYLAVSKLYLTASRAFEEAAALNGTQPLRPQGAGGSPGGAPDRLGEAIQRAGEVRGRSVRAAGRPREEAVALMGRVMDLERGQMRETLEEAVRVLGRVTDVDPGYAEAWFRLARLSYRLGDVGGAWEDLSRAVAIEPGHAAAHWTLGTMLVYEQSSLDVAAYLRARGVIQENEPARVKMLAIAARSFEEARKADPQVYGVLSTPFLKVAAGLPILAEDLDALRGLQARRKFMQETPLVLGALLSGVRNNLPGFDVRLRKTLRVDMDEALRQLDLHLELDPASSIGRRCRGFLRVAMGDNKGAIRDLEFVHRLEQSPSLLRRADISEAYRLAGRFDKAAEVTAQYLAAQDMAAGAADPRAPIMHAESLVFAHRSQEALDMLDEVLARPDLPVSVRMDAAFTGLLAGVYAGDAERAAAFLVRGFSGDVPEKYQGHETTEELVALDRYTRILSPALLNDGAYGLIFPYTSPPAAKQAAARLWVLVKSIPDLRAKLSEEALDTFDEDQRVMVFKIRAMLADPDFNRNLVAFSGRLPLARTFKKDLELDLRSAISFFAVAAALVEEHGVLSFQGLILADDFCARAAHHLRAGRLEDAAADLERGLARNRLHVPAAYGLATVRARLAARDPKWKEPALEALRYAIRIGWERLDWTREDPDFAALREEPGFLELVK